MARVLLVEDDELQLEMRRRLLEMAGHEVTAVCTREQARPHLGVCQVMVADLIPESAELSGEAPDGIRVIVLTGRLALPAGVRADRLLHKPCSTRELLAAIDELS